ncbi:hypothetical protein, partial [Paenibacillus humicus]|uniref:hypothetical protein n=1 Tax=Paenibacillus humicus TaxID=412861 RepID=UPI001C3F6A6B
IHPSIHSSFYPFILLSIHPSIHSSFYPFILPFVHPTICSSFPLRNLAQIIRSGSTDGQNGLLPL